MASPLTYRSSKDGKLGDGPPRKKLKTSELPLSSSTRTTIDVLSNKFKKKGGYDALRNEIWKELEGSGFEADFSRRLLDVADQELEKNPGQLLKVERTKASMLLEGAIERAGVYQFAEAEIEQLLDAHMPMISEGIRSVRREDIGEEAAAAEEAKGGKTDEQYAEEAAQKQAAREKAREEAYAREQAALEERRRAAKAKRREEEQRIEAEQERKKEEKEARLKAERDAEEERQRGRDREHARLHQPRESYHERDRERDDRSRRHEYESRHRYDRDPRGSSGMMGHVESPRTHLSTTDLSKVDISKSDLTQAGLSQEEKDRLEEEALKALTREGNRAKDDSRRGLYLVDHRLIPPPRKTAPASAIEPDSRDKRLPLSKYDEYGSRDRGSRRTSRSRSRHRREARTEEPYTKKEERSESKERDSRRRRDSSRDRDDYKYRSTRDRSTDRRKRSPSHAKEVEVSQSHAGSPPPPRDPKLLEEWKLAEAKKREAEAKAYLDAQKHAIAHGLPIPGWTDRSSFPALAPTRPRDDRSSPALSRKPESSYHREGRTSTRSPSRRTTRIMRSTSPENIDRYVPGAKSSRHRDSSSHRRDRSKDRDTRRSRDDEKSRRRSRSRSRRRDRKASSRSRSPYSRRDRDSRRERSRSRGKDSKRRERSRDRGSERDRHHRDRDDRDYERKRSRSRERRRESRRE